MTENRLRRLSKKLQTKTGKDDRTCRHIIQGVEDQNHRREMGDSEIIQNAVRDLKRYG